MGRYLAFTNSANIKLAFRYRGRKLDIQPPYRRESTNKVGRLASTNRGGRTISTNRGARRQPRTEAAEWHPLTGAVKTWNPL